MSRPPQLWDGVVRRLGADMPAFSLDPWIRPLIAEDRNGRLHLRCPSHFHRERLRQRLLPKITEFAAAEAGRPVEVELEVGGGPAAIESNTSRAGSPWR